MSGGQGWAFDAVPNLGQILADTRTTLKRVIEERRYETATGPQFAETSGEALKGAVKSSRIVKPLHDWCANELIEQGVHPSRVRLEAKVTIDDTAEKIHDLYILGRNNEPHTDIAISLKSQLASLNNNRNSRREEASGSAQQLHLALPELVTGYVHLVAIPPVNTAGAEADRADRLLEFSPVTGNTLAKFLDAFDSMNYRATSQCRTDVFERAALMFVDLSMDEPELLTSLDHADQDGRIIQDGAHRAMLDDVEQRGTLAGQFERLAPLTMVGDLLDRYEDRHGKDTLDELASPRF